MTNRTVVASTCLICCLAALATTPAANPELKPEAFQSITINYGRGAYAGLGLRGSPTGVTVVTLPNAKLDTTKLAISIAEPADGRDVKDFVIFGRDKAGAEIKPDVGAASGAGR